MTIYGHTYILPITLSFLVQSRIFLYRDAQQMIIYQISYIMGGWELGCIIKLSFRQRPFTGAAVAWSAKGVETPKLHQKIPLWVGLFRKPYLQTEFSQKLRLNPPLKAYRFAGLNSSASWALHES